MTANYYWHQLGDSFNVITGINVSANSCRIFLTRKISLHFCLYYRIYWKDRNSINLKVLENLKVYKMSATSDDWNLFRRGKWKHLWKMFFSHNFVVLESQTLIIFRRWLYMMCRLVGIKIDTSKLVVSENSQFKF